MSDRLTGLTPDEDAELRRLHFLARFGAVASRLAQRYSELRERDRRTSIREPADVVVTPPTNSML